MGARTLNVIDLGRCDYDAAWKRQMELHARAAKPDSAPRSATHSRVDIPGALPRIWLWLEE